MSMQCLGVSLRGGFSLPLEAGLRISQRVMSREEWRFIYGNVRACSKRAGDWIPVDLVVVAKPFCGPGGAAMFPCVLRDKYDWECLSRRERFVELRRAAYLRKRDLGEG